jgi:hypothetical protein
VPSRRDGGNGSHPSSGRSSRALTGSDIASPGSAVGVHGAGPAIGAAARGSGSAHTRGAIADAGGAVRICGAGRPIRLARCHPARAQTRADIADAGVAVRICGAGSPVRLARCGPARAQAGGVIAGAGVAVGVGDASRPSRCLRRCGADIRDTCGCNGSSNDKLRDHGSQRWTSPTSRIALHRPASFRDAAYGGPGIHNHIPRQERTACGYGFRVPSLRTGPGMTETSF